MDEYSKMYERHQFHARLGDLIVKWYAEERCQIAEDDPARDEKLEANRAACKAELAKLNQYFWGQKQIYACEGCPLMDYWAEHRAETMDGEK